MRLSATAIFRPRGSTGQFIEAHITPGVRASVLAAARSIEADAKSFCPVDTGALRESIRTDVDEPGKTIVAHVGPHMPYSAYVEFGTGIRGASSPGAGDGPYSGTWPGQVAQPYLRPALEGNREPIRELFRSNLGVGLAT